MDESLYILHTRNYKQETMYYIQETKTISEKFVHSYLRETEIYNGFPSRKLVV